MKDEWNKSRWSKDKEEWVNRVCLLANSLADDLQSHPLARRFTKSVTIDDHAFGSRNLRLAIALDFRPNYGIKPAYRAKDPDFSLRRLTRIIRNFLKARNLDPRLDVPKCVYHRSKVEGVSYCDFEGWDQDTILVNVTLI